MVLLADGPVFPERWLHPAESAPDVESAPVGPPGGSPLPGGPTGNAVSDGDVLCLPLDGSVRLEAMERRILTEALARNGNNVSLAARVLGTSREKWRYRVQKHGLKASD